MYVALVGPPGGGKGTAMRPAEQMLREIGVKLAPRSTTREAFIRNLRRAGEESGEAGPQATLSDIKHCSLTVFAQELAVFIPAGNDQFLSDLTDLYDCIDPWDYETKHQGIDYIEAPFLNILGGTTPDLLSRILPIGVGTHGGLASRMIFVYSGGKEKAVPFPWEHPIIGTDRYEALRDDLDKISLLKGPFSVDKSYLDAWGAFYNDTFKTPVLDDQYYKGYDNRRHTHVMKLCMVLAASRDDSMTITKTDLNAAIGILKEVEGRVGAVFSAYGRSDMAEILPEIMRFIATHKEVSMSQLLAKFIKDVNKRELEDALVSLRFTKFCETYVGNGGALTIRYIEEEKED